MGIWLAFDHDIREKKKRGNGRVQRSFINFANIISLPPRTVTMQ